VLVATLSHFLELDALLELLGSGRNTDLTEDQVDAIFEPGARSLRLAVTTRPSFGCPQPF
jgi:hypothetical protein